MTGWRLGYVCAPSYIVEKMVKIQQHTATCPNSFAQFGAITALSSSIEDVDFMVKEYEKRRNKLIQAIKKMPMYSYFVPQGAFYLFLNIKRFGNSSLEIADKMLNNVHLAVMPGRAFGRSGEGYVRLSFAVNDDILDKALLRLDKFQRLFG
jgi:aminotransferase